MTDTTPPRPPRTSAEGGRSKAGDALARALTSLGTAGYWEFRARPLAEALLQRLTADGWRLVREPEVDRMRLLVDAALDIEPTASPEAWSRFRHFRNRVGRALGGHDAPD